MNLKNKNIVVVGLGKSGFAAAQLLKKQGAKVKVTEASAKDSVACLAKKLSAKGIEVEIGKHTEAFVWGADLVVASPGVPDKAMPLVWARQKNIKIIDEIELAYNFCKAPIIAITGTNGKSTTTTLIGHILKKSGFNPVVCGNIGEPFSEKIHSLNKKSVIVLELSSFQLSRIGKFRPKIAIFLNATENHLDRHADFKEYFNAKIRIFKNQTASDWAVINAEDRNLVKAANKIKAKKIFFSPELKPVIARSSAAEGGGTTKQSQGGDCFGLTSSGLAMTDIKEFAGIDNSSLFVKTGKKINYICNASDIKIKGRHNFENTLAALSAAFIFGVPAEKIKQSVRTFKGLEHRCEHVATIKGVKFINDSKSTTVDAAIKAFSVCGGKIVLIAGGRDKMADFSILRFYLNGNVKKIILIGEAKEKIRKALSGFVDMLDASSMEAAVKIAFKMAKPGYNVLLSPMCTSFDMFEDFQHRGRVFKDAVQELKKCVLQE